MLERAHFDGYCFVDGMFLENIEIIIMIIEVIVIAQESASKAILQYIREVSTLNLHVDMVSIPDNTCVQTH